MGDLTVVFAIFCIFVAPLWLIVHYTARRRQLQSLARENEKMLSDSWPTANRMEGGVKARETILDTQTPNWSDKA